MNLRILFLKTKKLSHFLRGESDLIDSVIVNRKKEFLKKLLCVWKRGVLYISSRVQGVSSRNQAEEIRRIFIF